MIRYIKNTLLISIFSLCIIFLYTRKFENTSVKNSPEEIFGYNIIIQSYDPFYKAIIGKLTKIDNFYYLNNIDAKINDTIITATQGRLDKNENIMYLNKSPRIVYSNYLVSSQTLNINLGQSLVTSEGNIHITNTNSVITAKKLILDLKNKNLILKDNVQTLIKFNHIN